MNVTSPAPSTSPSPPPFPPPIPRYPPPLPSGPAIGHGQECHWCGYSLNGLLLTDACPECARPVRASLHWNNQIGLQGGPTDATEEEPRYWWHRVQRWIRKRIFHSPT